MAVLLVETFSGYNGRRHGKPWGAVVEYTDAGGAVYNFTRGRYHGTEDGGDLYIDCEVGDIIVVGQKDLRKPQKSTNDWYIVADSEHFLQVTRAEAYKHWLMRNAA